MQFKSKPIRGRGRGRRIGVPTINLAIPKDFDLDEGIYAVMVYMDNEKFMGAMHYGPIPVFNEGASLEINLLDTSDPIISEEVEVEVKEKIRDIQNFKTTEQLVKQIEDDIRKIRQILGDYQLNRKPD